MNGKSLKREFTNVMFKPETYEIILLFDDQNDTSFQWIIHRIEDKFSIW